MVERTEVRAGMKSRVLERHFFFKGKKLLHLDSWRCEASIKYQLRTEKQMDMESLPRNRPASLFLMPQISM